MSPGGTAENSPGCNPGYFYLRNELFASGQLTQDQVLGNFQPSLRDCSLAHANPGLNVLGYSQPSLRDSIGRGEFSRKHARCGQLTKWRRSRNTTSIVDIGSFVMNPAE
jgi:hypothetical protein